VRAVTHTTLADVCEALEDGDWIESKDQGGEEFRLLQVSNLGVNDFVETGNYRYITEETFNRLRCREVLPGHILLSRMPKPIGRAWLVSEMPWRMVTAVDVAIAVPNETLVNPRYLTYLLNAPSSLRYCEQRAAGATRPRITRRALATLPLRLPPRQVQDNIADILSAYDDLIENNRLRMALLEEAARQLYREWFVRLRFPGYEHAQIANGVPTGWRRVALADACESLEDGDWVESKDQGGEDYRLLQISNIGVNEFVETGNFRYVTEETFRRLNCREVVAGQILISRMPKPIGRAWLVTEMPWRMITAVDVAIVAPAPAIADPYFLTYFLNSPENLERCERRAVGATRPRVARRELASLPLLLPPRLLQRNFREAAEPLNQQRANVYRQNQKLGTARDLVLPRLMSGEIAV
jgi:type I restriction enzyme S subunit